jgi:anti-sigma factor RsiW
MSDHLSPVNLNSLADRELSAEDLAIANEHLAGCPSCTTDALYQAFLKAATARAGQRYSPPAHLLKKITYQSERQTSEPHPETAARSRGRFGVLGWATAAAVLLVSVSVLLMQRSVHQAAIASAEHVALVIEVSDQHIATLAASSPPQVVSSDKHTVKPWFQGRIPFSFNLPDNLPKGTTLDGANLTYLSNQPVAQLLYSIGKHRVSVFVARRSGAIRPVGPAAEQSGFHVMSFSTDDLEVIAVSDVDQARLSDLVSVIEKAQTGTHKQVN